MPQKRILIRHRIITAQEEDTVRGILGVGRQEGRFLSGDVKTTPEQLDQIVSTLEVDHAEARMIARMVAKNWPVSGQAEHDTTKRSSGKVKLFTLGDQLPDETEGVLSHEIGHVMDYDASYGLPDNDIRNDSFMRELIAVYQSRNAPGYSYIHDKQMDKLRSLFEQRVATNPGSARGMSFDEWVATAKSAVDAESFGKYDVAGRVKRLHKKPTKRSTSNKVGTQVRGVRR
jgi:hypothetical protein